MKYRYDEDDKLYTREEAEEIAKRKAQEMVDEMDSEYMEHLSANIYELYFAYKIGKLDQAIEKITKDFLEYMPEEIWDNQFIKESNTYIYFPNGESYTERDAYSLSRLLAHSEGLTSAEYFSKYFTSEEE